MACAVPAWMKLDFAAVLILGRPGEFLRQGVFGGRGVASRRRVQREGRRDGLGRECVTCSRGAASPSGEPWRPVRAKPLSATPGKPPCRKAAARGSTSGPSFLRPGRRRVMRTRFQRRALGIARNIGRLVRRLPGRRRRRGVWGDWRDIGRCGPAPGVWRRRQFGRFLRRRPRGRRDGGRRRTSAGPGAVAEVSGAPGSRPPPPWPSYCWLPGAPLLRRRLPDRPMSRRRPPSRRPLGRRRRKRPNCRRLQTPARRPRTRPMSRQSPHTPRRRRRPGSRRTRRPIFLAIPRARRWKRVLMTRRRPGRE